MPCDFIWEVPNGDVEVTTVFFSFLNEEDDADTSDSEDSVRAKKENALDALRATLPVGSEFAE